MSRKNQKYPKVSVIVPCFHTEKYIDRCLKSLTNQTYRELEIICVNDYSGEKMEKKLDSWKKKDKRIKIVNNEKNLGLFHTRLEGAKVATGDYIACVDSDDYVERDFYRSLVFEAIKSDSDITIANICSIFNDGNYTATAFDKELLLPSGTDDFFSHFIASEGRYYRWHVWDKLINKKIWDKVMPLFEEVKERFMMCEDVVFSTTLFANANRVSFVDDIFYYYDCSISSSATSASKLKVEKIIRNIDDIAKAFSYTQYLLDKQKKKYDKNHVIVWRNNYINSWLDKTKSVIPRKYSYILKYVKKEYPDYSDVDLEVYNSAFQHMVKYDNKTQKIVDTIAQSDLVSFDVFDTLVVRPFYIPKDLFETLDDKFMNLCPNFGILKFSKMRVESEHRCRVELVSKKKEDITLDEIYEMIAKRYNIDKAVLSKMKKAEIEAEIRFCKTREYGKKFYDLARYLGKKISITSDMYLPLEVVQKILEKNGYTDYDNIYISCEAGCSKSSGNLFKMLKKKYKKCKICHIDDRKDICNKANEFDISGIFIPRTLDAFQKTYGVIPSEFCDYNHDNSVFMLTSGVRTSVALAANKFFDNPYRPRDPEAVFNDSPFELGYYALGMQLLSLGSWILKDSKQESLDSLCFLARDGYLPYRAVSILKNEPSLQTKTEMKYIYTSRRATMPIVLNDGLDFYAVSTYIYWGETTPASVIKQMSDVLKDADYNEKTFTKKFGFSPNRRFESEDEFLEFLDKVRNLLFDKKKYDHYYSLCKKYYSDALSGKSGVFDIGYTGKPELIFSKIVNKPIYTYFVHVNSSQAFDCNRVGNNVLKTYFDYKPTITGLLRELLYSSTDCSCNGYEEKDGKVVPTFREKEYTDVFSEDVLNAVQSAALEFVKDYAETFEGLIDCYDYNRYYMSIPLEYYYQYSKEVDRRMFVNLRFDHDADKIVRVLDFWKWLEDNYNDNYNLVNSAHFDAKEVHPLPRRRSKRIAYYMLFDRPFLRDKIKVKINDMSTSPKFIRRFSYCMLKDRKRLLRGAIKTIKHDDE